MRFADGEVTSQLKLGGGFSALPGARLSHSALVASVTLHLGDRLRSRREEPLLRGLRPHRLDLEPLASPEVALESGGFHLEGPNLVR